MTSEEIIQRLLDEKKISVMEAMIILKDLAKITFSEIFRPADSKKIPNYPGDNIVVMYGVTTNPYTYSNDHCESEEQFASISTTDIK